MPWIFDVLDECLQVISHWIPLDSAFPPANSISIPTENQNLLDLVYISKSGINGTFWKAQNEFTIKRYNIITVVNILKRIADSTQMLLLSELLHNVYNPSLSFEGKLFILVKNNTQIILYKQLSP